MSSSFSAVGSVERVFSDHMDLVGKGSVRHIEGLLESGVAPEEIPGQFLGGARFDHTESILILIQALILANTMAKIVLNEREMKKDQSQARKEVAEEAKRTCGLTLKQSVVKRAEPLLDAIQNAISELKNTSGKA